MLDSRWSRGWPHPADAGSCGRSEPGPGHGGSPDTWPRPRRLISAKRRGRRPPVIRSVDAEISFAPKSVVYFLGIYLYPLPIGELLRAIDGDTDHFVTAYALKLAPLLFVRPVELRHAEWTKFDLDGHEPQWRIPAEKMKMGEQHIVPLSKQALALLRELQPLTRR